MKELKAGLFPNVSWEDYRAIPALNISLLEHADYTLAHLKHAETAPPESGDHLDIGTATHAKLFEPERFGQLVVVLEPGKIKTAGLKKETRAAGKVLLSADEYRTVIEMSDSVHRHSAARELCEARGFAECTIVWQDQNHGLWCKGRLDRFCQWHMWPVVLDLKTTKRAKAALWRYDLRRFKYHIKAAWYLDGLKVISPSAERRFVWLCVEKEPPYEVALYEPTDETLDRGRFIYQQWLAQYAQAKASGEWPGYPNGIEPIALPDLQVDSTQEEYVA
jgi:exodeoxyribonuclease VIII